MSGTGVVADGCEFPDGRSVMVWRGECPSVTLFDSAEKLERVHGHGGATELVYLD